MLQAQKRQILGRKVKALRKAGTLPASVYGKKVKSLPVQVQAVDFDKVFAATGETGIIQLKIEKEKETRPVLAKNRQKDPVTDKIIHIDFHQVDLKEKVTVAIPIETAGESPAVKEKSAVLVMVLDEVKVEALPQDLPEKFVVDISGLKEFNESILVKDLKVDRQKVKMLADEGETVVMVQQPKEEVEKQPPSVEAEAVPVEGEAEIKTQGEGKEPPQEKKEENKKKEG